MRTPILASLSGVMLVATLGTPSYAGASPPVAESGPSTAGLIVWTNRAADGRENLLIANADGTGRRALTHAGPGVVQFDAQFSPNGEWIAYEQGDEDSFQVRLVRPDGSDNHRLPMACDDPCLGIGTPTWLTNRRLAVTRVDGPITNDIPAEVLLWTVKSDGSGLRRLSPASAAGVFEDGYAHASRDGSYLTFKRLRLSDGASTIVRVDRDGGQLRRLLPWGLGVEVNDLSTAAAGPTKNLVLFEAYGRGDPDATFVDLGTVPATCGSLKACRKQLVWLTDNETSGRRNANPHWSPNGRDYVFTDRANIDTEDVQIWTARYGSDERREISSSPRFDYRPDWGRG